MRKWFQNLDSVQTLCLAVMILAGGQVLAGVIVLYGYLITP